MDRQWESKLLHASFEKVLKQNLSERAKEDEEGKLVALGENWLPSWIRIVELGERIELADQIRDRSYRKDEVRECAGASRSAPGAREAGLYAACLCVDYEACFAFKRGNEFVPSPYEQWASLEIPTQSGIDVRPCGTQSS